MSYNYEKFSSLSDESLREITSKYIFYLVGTIILLTLSLVITVLFFMITIYTGDTGRPIEDAAVEFCVLSIILIIPLTMFSSIVNILRHERKKRKSKIDYDLKQRFSKIKQLDDSVLRVQYLKGILILCGSIIFFIVIIFGTLIGDWYCYRWEILTVESMCHVFAGIFSVITFFYPIFMGLVIIPYLIVLRREKKLRTLENSPSQ